MRLAHGLAITVFVSAALLIAAWLAWRWPTPARTHAYLSQHFEADALSTAEWKAYKLWKGTRYRNSGYSSQSDAVSLTDFQKLYGPACLFGEHDRLSDDGRHLDIRVLAYVFYLRAPDAASSVEPGAIVVRVSGDLLGAEAHGDALQTSNFRAELQALKISSYNDLRPAGACRAP